MGCPGSAHQHPRAVEYPAALGTCLPNGQIVPVAGAGAGTPLYSRTCLMDLGSGEHVRQACPSAVTAPARVRLPQVLAQPQAPRPLMALMTALPVRRAIRPRLLTTPAYSPDPVLFQARRATGCHVCPLRPRHPLPLAARLAPRAALTWPPAQLPLASRTIDGLDWPGSQGQQAVRRPLALDTCVLSTGGAGRGHG